MIGLAGFVFVVADFLVNGIFKKEKHVYLQPVISKFENGNLAVIYAVSAADKVALGGWGLSCTVLIAAILILDG